MNEILKNIYTMRIPLRDSPLKWINSYIIKGEKRHLLIDTAFNCDESETAIIMALAAIDIAIEDTDIFITHMHVDHCGLVARLKRDENKVYASAKDAKMINDYQNPAHWNFITNHNIYTGTPESSSLLHTDHVASLNLPSHEVEFEILAIGDTISYGGYNFSIVDLKGHTPGQIGLYCEDEKALFCGDHILDRISPNITAWDFENDYLGFYMENLKKVKDLNLKRLFTAHRELPTNINERIEYLILHHEERLQLVRDILQKKPNQTGYEVARQMDWSIKTGFDDFPLMQKWFACSEALAHLQCLYLKGELTQTIENEVLFYTLAR